VKQHFALWTDHHNEVTHLLFGCNGKSSYFTRKFHAMLAPLLILLFSVLLNVVEIMGHEKASQKVRWTHDVLIRQD